MKVNINHPSFISFLETVSSSILSNVTVSNYFNLSQDKKMGVLYMVFKLMKKSLSVRAKLTDLELRSFVSVLWKRNEEAENYEFAAILNDIAQNFDAVNEFTKTPLGFPFVVFLGVLIGVITGFVGAGGGFIIVPVLMIFVRLNFKKAIGTSLCIVALNSIIGFLGNLGHQDLDWMFLIGISAICGVGILLGSLLSNKISSQKLKPAFGWFTLVVGVFVLVKELFFS
jgi:uncharacterized membrane protein YfcA